MRGNLWVLGLAVAMGCVVEPVRVDTGGPQDTAEPTDAPVRPGAPDDDAGTEVPPVEALPEPFVEPAEVAPGEHRLVFVVADGAADLTEAVAISLYGAPDVVIATWAVRDADELAVSLEVATGSPQGSLDVVVDLADGGVLRIPEGLTVR